MSSLPQTKEDVVANMQNLEAQGLKNDSKVTGLPKLVRQAIWLDGYCEGKFGLSCGEIAQEHNGRIRHSRRN